MKNSCLVNWQHGFRVGLNIQYCDLTSENLQETIVVIAGFPHPLQFCSASFLVPDNISAMQHLNSKCLCPRSPLRPSLGCSAVRCLRPQLKTAIIFRLSRNDVMLVGGLFVKVYNNSLLIWEPLCHSDMYFCSCAKCPILLSVGCACLTGFKFCCGFFFVCFWKSL